ncbi:bcl-2-like protein 10 [Bufo bufo]|uniref:bcl-2-like protein 10 n=1 Tax=Bufo bufo TaxID=8384 RepID=UPI001ABEA38E|nr:bcl-2-like protein 10 [Bufo bufo]
MSETQLHEEETRALVEDYLHRCLGNDRPQPPPPVADTLWQVAQEVHLGNSAFFKSCEELDVEPCAILQRVAHEVALEGGLNWGRVVVLIVFAGTLTQRHRKRRAGTPRELAGVLSQFLVRDQGDWFQKNGGWEGFQKFSNNKSNHKRQEQSHFSNALMAAAGVGLAGLVFLLAVR